MRNGAVDAFLSDAQRHGAEIRFETAVRSIAVRGEDLVEVRTDGDAITARRVVLAAGAWLAKLAGELVPLPKLVVTQQQIAHFPRLDPSAPPWPSVIHHGQPPIYHLAGGRDGTAADDRKIARHDGGHPDNRRPRRPIARPERERGAHRLRTAWLPGLVPDSSQRGDLPLHLDAERGLRARPGRAAGDLLGLLGARRQVRPAHRGAGRPTSPSGQVPRCRPGSVSRRTAADRPVSGGWCDRRRPSAARCRSRPPAARSAA